MTDIVFLFAVLFAAVAATTFAVAYAVAFRWEATGEGRSLLAVSVAQSVLAWVYVLRRVDELSDSLHLGGTAPMNTLLVLGWTTTAAVFVWRICGLRPPKDRR